MADDGSPVDGGRSAQNAAMLDTLFLYGGSAVWIEPQCRKAGARFLNN